jgi:hypothetical protein
MDKRYWNSLATANDIGTNIQGIDKCLFTLQQSRRLCRQTNAGQTPSSFFLYPAHSTHCVKKSIAFTNVDKYRQNTRTQKIRKLQKHILLYSVSMWVKQTKITMPEWILHSQLIVDIYHVCLSTHPPTYQPTYLPTYLPTYHLYTSSINLPT